MHASTLASVSTADTSNGYDTTLRTRMIVDEYSSIKAAEQNQQELNSLHAARLLKSVQLAERTDLKYHAQKCTNDCTHKV